MTPEDIRLNDKVAFITGGAGGLGAGIAENLANFGARVVIADIDAAAGERLVAAIREKGGDALFVPTDVNHSEQIIAAVARAAEHFGRLDILVNNAGGVRRTPFLEQTEKSWRKHIDFNLISTLTATQAAAKVMIEGGRGGTIVNIASSEGLRAAPGFAVYAACKAGMISFTRSMALELAEHDIRVHALAPDMILTPGLKPYFDAVGEAGAAARNRYIPMGRLGSTDELAGVVIFLVSSLASYVTGLTLPVDGGAIASSGWTRSPHTGAWDLYHAQ
ncbi:SDR family NAD(P)-dependent oxidoreductase [Pseudomonas aeruginosa]|uniref:SDR family NAD(P)-dependent oxidoreductase n=1 Tax=Pseudomonas aeruginosa TaxID=287 RepID=UPI00071BF371|nr:glucose 1-dehydrogenase [Pseudomonas aeruginosa]KSE28064.1 short-chain dehydrogenase [Pseudomonas aeruginosa]KSG99963.1 short-chain dehydrogenase [Pseudomonas aeruginosa]KSS49703.1 short-chain dehydrogenase [Pseudomonas aeruginosa]MBA5113620.1 glucose 1-dehydrogenase [Pseudomonas aeruginosa]OWI78565.1 short-chain dehydrogenase [Pseudomonas aeruginosa]